jgi:ABC-2 type transport system ATP-binding protein
MDEMITTSGLVKRFGDVTALDGLDLVVRKGTVLGLLGPNGAGKTTAVRILTTLLRPDGGSARIAGIDVLAEPAKVRERIGLSGQTAAVDEHLTGFENLEMVGRLYRLGRRAARERAHVLIDRLGLADAAGRPAKTYSGGMQRRLDLAAALVASPQVLFLDEPTTGLDPASRLGLWETIQDLVDGGSTVLLTTQYMEEADKLADNIVVIDHGRVIAEGTPGQLKTKLGGERVEIILERRSDMRRAYNVLDLLAVGEVQMDHQARRLTATVGDGAETLRKALLQLRRADVALLDVGLRRPTLDDVFLSLTGHVAGNGNGNGHPARSKEKELAR